MCFIAGDRLLSRGFTPEEPTGALCQRTQWLMSDRNVERATWLHSKRPTKYMAWENWDLDKKGG